MSEAIAYVSPEYLSCVETAKLIRQALKRAFPGQKFSVRSDSYSGGASIHVKYTDGPARTEVEAVVGVFAGADFDGMIDMKCYSEHWLEPDGTVHIAHAQGTQRSRGYLPEHIGDPHTPGARLVRFGADFVFAHRDYSPEVEKAAQDEVAAWLGEPYEQNKTYDVRTYHDRETGETHLVRTGGNGNGSWGAELVAGLLYYRDLRKATA